MRRQVQHGPAAPVGREADEQAHGVPSTRFSAEWCLP